MLISSTGTLVRTLWTRYQSSGATPRVWRLIRLAEGDGLTGIGASSTWKAKWSREADRLSVMELRRYTAGDAASGDTPPRRCTGKRE